jgi:hypothetical protein
MPLSFDAARKAAGVQTPAYVPLSERAANATTGGLLPGSNGTAVPQGVRQPNIAQDTKTNPTSAPPNADAAPNAQSITIFTGLCDALNEFQQKLKEKNLCEIPDQYEILFSPTTMEQETVVIKGTTAYKSTPMANAKNPNAQLNPKSDSMNTTARAISVTAGTQIVQFIDQIMRGSTYITKQSNIIYDEATGNIIPNPDADNSKGFQWYKISFQATNLGWDSIRNEFAYKMTFIVNQYEITDIQSQFFNTGSFRGTHKSFYYWFTGENTQILDFEQEYNNLYSLVLTSPPNSGAPAADGAVPTSPNDILLNLTNERTSPSNNLPSLPRSFAAGTSVSSQYADKGAALIGASAADFLYSMSNQMSVKLKIVGDPAWLMQGEITNSITPENLSWSPFNPDGAINYEAGQVLFDIVWNRAGDYNYETGLVDVNGQTRNADGTLSLLQPQAHTVYVAQTVRSTFSQGKFTQELEGKAYTNNASATAATTARQRAKTNNQIDGNPVPTVDSRQPDRDFDTIETTQGTSDNPNPDVQAAVGPVVAQNLQPQSEAQPPTSNGDIDAIAAFGANPLPISTGNQTAQQSAQAVAAAENTQLMAPRDE